MCNTLAVFGPQFLPTAPRAAVHDLTEPRSGLLISDKRLSFAPMRATQRLSSLKSMGNMAMHDGASPARNPAAASGGRADYSPTPDRRYFVVRGRLWRLSNPALDPATHEGLVRELMSARQAVLDAKEPPERIQARGRVDAAKRALGERGEVWWHDGAPDYNRQLAVDTPYADWFMGLSD